MRHYLRLDFDYPADQTMAWLRNADSVWIRHPEQTTYDQARPMPHTLTLFGEETRFTVEVLYEPPIPAYSQLGPGTQIAIYDAIHPPPPNAYARVHGRWEERAKRSDWKTEPMLADQRVPLNYQRNLTAAEYRWLCNGEIPRQQEDKWFLFHENWHLHIYRSLTGQPVWEVDMNVEGDRYVINRAWQYMPEGTMEMLDSVIDWRCKEAQRIYDR